MLISDQRPRFHFAPSQDFTNDIQGPFYDPHHGLYHMGFAWHVNGTRGISSAPNRWSHIVSRDLARWKVVSTTPDRAMLSPDQPYDDLAVMTGSVTLVHGMPTALYSCRGRNASGVSLAWAANRSDPLLTVWRKSANNPVIPVGGPIRSGFRDPSSAFRSGGRWRMLTACSDCNGTGSMLGLFSSDDFARWEFTSTPLKVPSLECPDAWPVVTLGGSATELFAIKLSQASHEVVHVGSWDAEAQVLRDVVPPRLPAINPPADELSQLLDATTYASKSFFDPVHGQQVWTSWIREMFNSPDGSCRNATVCGSHTLPRSMLYDSELRAHVTPPVAQTELLRLEKLFSLPAPLQLPAGGEFVVPASGMQLEIRATFAMPVDGSLTLGVATRRSADLRQQTSSHVTVDARAASVGHELGAETAYGGGDLNVATLASEVDNVEGVMPEPQRWSHSIKFPLKPSDRNLSLAVYVDHSVIEAYAQHGRGVVTTRSYPTDDALGISIFCKQQAVIGRTIAAAAAAAEATLLALDVWRMDEIWVD